MEPCPAERPSSGQLSAALPTQPSLVPGQLQSPVPPSTGAGAMGVPRWGWVAHLPPPKALPHCLSGHTGAGFAADKLAPVPARWLWVSADTLHPPPARLPSPPGSD